MRSSLQSKQTSEDLPGHRPSLDGRCWPKGYLQPMSVSGREETSCIPLSERCGGVSVDLGVKSVLFSLFICALGYESGPQFFKSLGNGRA